ncbi:uncharacterized protein [Clytia hemisphaerica]
MYGDLRLEDIEELSTMPVMLKGVQVNDHFRFFKGDAPACQLEAGHQKGGDYFCWGCPMYAKRGNDIAYVFGRKSMDLQDRIHKLNLSSYMRTCLKNHKANVLDKISKDEIRSELSLRGIKFLMDDLKPALLAKLVEEMAGIHRLPALLHFKPNATLRECFLERYEVLEVEPLHAIKGHIYNMYEDIPGRLPEDEKKKMSRAVKVSFKKEARTGADYRRSLIDVCVLLRNKIDPDFYNLLLQIIEIQEIIYLNEVHRTNAKVFRYLNQSFLHLVAMEELMPQPKKLTTRKTHGQYLHSLTGHGPMRYRIMSLPSINAEDEERIFHPLKKVAVTCTNHHPENVLMNLFVRYQIRAKFTEEVSYKENKEHDVYVSENKGLLPPFKLSLVPFDLIESKPHTLQAHLERVADFLLFENVWRETKKGILFDDKSEELFKRKELHHFRKYTLREERLYLEDCWQKLVNIFPERIPAFVIIDEDGNRTLLSNLTRPNPHLHDNVPLTSTPAKNRPSAEHEEEIDMVIEHSVINGTTNEASTFESCRLAVDDMQIQGASSVKDETKELPDAVCKCCGKEICIDESMQGPSTSENLTDASADDQSEERPQTSEHPIKIQDIQTENDKATAVYFARKESKTCQALSTVFPNLENEISEYEKMKTKFDKDKATYGDAMKNLAAKWEIRVVVLLDDVKKKFKAFDEQAAKKFTPDMKHDYDRLRNQLKILTVLKRRFSK